MAETATLSSGTRANDPGATLAIRRVGVFCGAEVTGVNLARPLDAASLTAIKAAHAEHGVLAFPNQDLTSEQLLAFGRHIGELAVHPFSTNDADTPELIIYDNKEGNPPPPTDVWHSDLTFLEAPPMGTILCSKIIPSPAGDTAFCNMAAVYEGLSDRMQSHLSGLEAFHDFAPFKNLFTQTEAGLDRLRYYEGIYPPFAHPVVRVHPVTGRKAIFVNPSFTQGIKDMDEQEGRMILDFLYQRTLRHEYHYRHRWQPGMVVFWDNRFMQHSALHDYYPARRMLERVTVRGERPMGDGPPAGRDELRRDLSPALSEFGSTRAARQND